MAASTNLDQRTTKPGSLRTGLRRAGPAGLLLAAGLVLAAVAVASRPALAQEAASQTWPAFVLVAGLLLIGLVAATDGLFASAGRLLAGATRSNKVLLVGTSVLIVVVTAVLNLDTSVAFLTPIAVEISNRRKAGGLLVAACLLLSNAGSLLLPGSNLTNLIVAGKLHLSGGGFAARMGLPWLASVAVTVAAIALFGRAELKGSEEAASSGPAGRLGVGAAAVVASVVLVLVDPEPALPVLAVGALAVGVRVVQGRLRAGQVLETLGLPVLLGLFGSAVAAGTLGRVWSGPQSLLGRLDPAGTAALAAAATVVVNNLPASALLSAHTPAHPFALLVGLDIGPNLLVTGSLAWVLWLRSARAAGGEAPLWRTTAMGAVSVPLALAAAVGALYLSGGG